MAGWMRAALGVRRPPVREEAYYHSAVNFTTLGYGDIVMSRQWRLLGPLEALNGSLMLGLAAAMLFTVMGRLAEARPPRSGGGSPDP